MGYSEVQCHICGVSFNINRFRTAAEPRSHAWHGYTGYQKSAFPRVEWTVDGHEQSGTGCMKAFREDAANEIKDFGSDYENTNGYGRVLTRKDRFLSDGESDEESWHPRGSTTDDDDDADDLEYNSGKETCSEDEHEDEEALKSERNSSVALYSRFLKSLIPTNPNPSEEYILPLFDIVDDDRCSQIDHDPSRRSMRDVDPVLEGNGQLWEHLVGPGCNTEQAYLGTNISEEEMRYCTVVQALVLRTDKDKSLAGRENSREEEAQTNEIIDQTNSASFIQELPFVSGEEDFEKLKRWRLSGLADYMPSRDDAGPSFLPPIRGANDVHCDNCVYIGWNDANGGNYDGAGMPFHPTCLEVWKRFCLNKVNKIDIDLLGSWWVISANSGDWDNAFERSEDVKAGNEQWWLHQKGKEYLAADPCYVPGLSNVVSLAEESGMNQMRDDTPNLLVQLPESLQYLIADHLEVVDLANFIQALPFRNDSFLLQLKRKFRARYPSLWELWCTLPYSKWTRLHKAHFQEFTEKLEEKRKLANEALRILKEEGLDEDLISGYWATWIKDLEDFQAEFLAEKFSAKPALVFDIAAMDLAEFVIKFDDALQNGRLKGIENRIRIWEDCEKIWTYAMGYKEKGLIDQDNFVTSSYMNSLR